MSAYKVRIGEKIYEVKILGANNNAIEVEVNGTKVTVSLESLGTTSIPTAKPTEPQPKPTTLAPTPTAPTTVPRPAAPVAAPGIIVSRVPGKVKEIKVSEGQKVEVGQTLLVIESMKMDIEIKANRAGIVKTIYVKPDQFIEKDKPLVLIESEAK